MSKRIKDDTLEAIEIFHRFNILPRARIINLISDVNMDDGEEFGVGYSMSTAFINNLTILESISSEPITVLLNTGGGSEEQGMAIYDAIRASKSHITIKVVGTCMSMGSVILQSADERVLSPNCMIMFHDGVSSSVVSNHAEAANSSRFFEQYGKRLDDILYARILEKRSKDNHAPMSRKAFDMMCLKGKYMFAEEAVELGLADRIDDGTSK